MTFEPKVNRIHAANKPLWSVFDNDYRMSHVPEIEADKSSIREVDSADLKHLWDEIPRKLPACDRAIFFGVPVLVRDTIIFAYVYRAKGYIAYRCYRANQERFLEKGAFRSKNFHAHFTLQSINSEWLWIQRGDPIEVDMAKAACEYAVALGKVDIYTNRL